MARVTAVNSIKWGKKDKLKDANFLLGSESKKPLIHHWKLLIDIQFIS